MHASLNSAAGVALLALVPFAYAGTATIQNNCDFDVYAWSVSNTQGPMNTLASNGGTYSEQYRLNPNGGGVSIKLSATTTLTPPITQFEYTLQSTLWFDISNVDGSPFFDYGMTVRAKPPSAACREITCEPGTTCGMQIYNAPYDDYAVSACIPEDDLIMILCSGSSASGSDSGSGSGSSSPAPVSPAPVSPVAISAAITTSAAAKFLTWQDVQAAAAPAASKDYTPYTTALVQAVPPTVAPTFAPNALATTVQSYVTDTTLLTAYYTAVQDVIDVITVPAAAATP